MQLKKLIRFIAIYGFGRTLFKVAGRLRGGVCLVYRPCANPDIALVGCGQFGVATLGYYVSRRYGRRFLWVFDLDQECANSARRILGATRVANSYKEILDDPRISIVFIASNHASHTDYAIRALNAGKRVHLEKPVSVSRSQLADLRKMTDGSRIFAGYNRPFSPAIRYLYRNVDDQKSSGGISLQCFVSGHVIPPDHWYRDPKEGTRICGNAGHWIDLFIHILAWRSLPDTYRIQMLPADDREPDDNFCLAISTEFGDIFSLMLTARTEPFEGINETINFQQDGVIAKIDDFRKVTIWRNSTLSRKKFWPKNAGHKGAALQVTGNSMSRSWYEVEASTLLMLRVTEMVLANQKNAEISLRNEFKKIDNMGAGS